MITKFQAKHFSNDNENEKFKIEWTTTTTLSEVKSKLWLRWCVLTANKTFCFPCYQHFIRENFNYWGKNLSLQSLYQLYS